MIEMAGETLLYAIIAEMVLALIPILHSRVTHHDLRDYGLKITRKLSVPGLTSSIGIGARVCNENMKVARRFLLR